MIILDTNVVSELMKTGAKRSGQMRAMRESAGPPSRASDMMIAGINAAAGAALATRNVRDFAGLDLAILDPWLGG